MGAAEGLPVVLTRDEVSSILQSMRGAPRLMATLLYGSGMRLLECSRLRVKDVDFATRQITVRGGKGDRDRVTLLAASTVEDLASHLERTRMQHESDIASGAGWIQLPQALAREYPRAAREWAWQWVFPATRIYVDRATGERRRHHLDEGVVQRAVSGGSPRCRDRQTGELPHLVAFFRNPPARERLRHPNRPGAPRTQGRGHDDGLHARARLRLRGGAQPLGSALCHTGIRRRATRPNLAAPSSTSATAGHR